MRPLSRGTVIEGDAMIIDIAHLQARSESSFPRSEGLGGLCSPLTAVMWSSDRSQPVARPMPGGSISRAVH